jgi:hypothetical protein
MGSERCFPPSGGSALDAAEAAFAALTVPPGELVLAGPAAAGWAGGRVGFAELRVRMADPALPAAVRQRVWSALVARRGEPAWLVGAVGVAMPMLRHTAGAFAAGCDGEPDDVDGEVLAGFLAVLRTVPASTARLGARLSYAAYGAGLAYAVRRGGCRAVLGAVPPPPWADPARVLSQAVAAGVLDRYDAALLRATRLDGVPLAVLSRPPLASGEELALRRRLAEARLAEALLAGWFDLKAAR